jgi:arginine-tRNA-protein transferase
MATAMNQFWEIPRASAEAMDRLWAEGWRHFGTRFFRYSASWHDGRQVRVLPLRVCLRSFSLSRSQRRVLKRHAAARVEFGPAFVDAQREALFDRHKVRFAGNVPDSLYDFLAPEPARVPCETMECRLWRDDRLFGVSYFDVGAEAISAVYAMFDPAESGRSPGVKMILEEIRWASERGFKYVYLGYCYDRPSHYDYKKRFRGLEYLDWQSMRFLPLDGAACDRQA